MSRLYATVHYHKASFGLPVYEIRDNKIFPTVNNQQDAYGLPTYEMQGSQLYPTVYNGRHPHRGFLPTRFVTRSYTLLFIIRKTLMVFQLLISDKVHAAEP